MRQLLLLLLPAVAAFVLTGCGGSSDPLHAVTSAAKRTLADTAGTNVVLHGATAFDSVHPDVNAKAASDFPARLTYEAIDLPATATVEHRKWFLLFQPRKVFFTRIPALGTLPSGKTWVSVSVGAGTTGPREAEFVAQAEGINPQLLLDEIASGAVGATSTGGRVIDHVPYSQYAVTVSLPRALASATGAIRVAIGKQLDALASRPGRPRTVRMTVLVDGPGHVARIATVVPGSRLGAVTMVFSEFGTPFAKTYPPASQVVDVSALKPSSLSPWGF
jgi:hypothetical protein